MRYEWHNHYDMLPLIAARNYLVKIAASPVQIKPLNPDFQRDGWFHSQWKRQYATGDQRLKAKQNRPFLTQWMRDMKAENLKRTRKVQQSMKANPKSFMNRMRGLGGKYMRATGKLSSLLIPLLIYDAVAGSNPEVAAQNKLNDPSYYSDLADQNYMKHVMRR